MCIVLISCLDRLEISKSSHSQVFFKIGFIKNCTKFVAPVLDPIFNKALLKRKLHPKGFLVNFSKVFRATILKNNTHFLLLQVIFTLYVLLGKVLRTRRNYRC